MSGLADPAFSSQRPHVASVAASGLVTAVAEGRTTITASITAGGVTRTADATVIVMGPVAAALVGQWTGTVAGTYGSAGATMQLNDDFSMTSVGDSGTYTCAVAGEWAIAGSTLTAASREVACTRTFIDFVATVSGTEMTGTWTASSGASGSFSLGKP